MAATAQNLRKLAKLIPFSSPRPLKIASGNAHFRDRYERWTLTHSSSSDSGAPATAAKRQWNRANEETIGWHAVADKADLDDAVAAAVCGFEKWRKTSAFERSKVMRRAAELLRERNESVARAMTMEQGKPLAELRMVAAAGADVIDWLAEEGRRAYGRIVPGRAPNVSQMVVKEPVGRSPPSRPANFPINQAVRKISAALAAGCSIIIKGPEDTPISCAALVAAFADAGLPRGVLNLVFGDPAKISAYLISHPAIRKISFTGSTAVGKQLASLAGFHMKRVTMELGGHAPAIVFEDADVDRAIKGLTASKFRNAGQVCVAPTRFIVHESVYPKFVDGFVKATKSIKVGDGLEEGVTMGPVAHARRRYRALRVIRLFRDRRTKPLFVLSKPCSPLNTLSARRFTDNHWYQWIISGFGDQRSTRQPSGS